MNGSPPSKGSESGMAAETKAAVLMPVVQFSTQIYYAKEDEAPFFGNRQNITFRTCGGCYAGLPR